MDVQQQQCVSVHPGHCKHARMQDWKLSTITYASRSPVSEVFLFLLRFLFSFPAPFSARDLSAAPRNGTFDAFLSFQNESQRHWHDRFVFHFLCVLRRACSSADRPTVHPTATRYALQQTGRTIAPVGKGRQMAAPFLQSLNNIDCKFIYM